MSSTPNQPHGLPENQSPLATMRSLRRKKRRSISLYNDEQIDAVDDLPQVAEDQEEEAHEEASLKEHSTLKRLSLLSSQASPHVAQYSNASSPCNSTDDRNSFSTDSSYNGGFDLAKSPSALSASNSIPSHHTASLLPSTDEPKPPYYDPLRVTFSRHTNIEMQDIIRENSDEEEEEEEEEHNNSGELEHAVTQQNKNIKSQHQKKTISLEESSDNEESPPVPPTLDTLPKVTPPSDSDTLSDSNDQCVGVDQNSNHSPNDDSSSIGSGETQNDSDFLDEGSFCEDQPDIDDYIAKYEAQHGIVSESPQISPQYHASATNVPNLDVNAQSGHIDETKPIQSAKRDAQATPEPVLVANRSNPPSKSTNTRNPDQSVSKNTKQTQNQTHTHKELSEESITTEKPDDLTCTTHFPITTTTATPTATPSPSSQQSARFLHTKITPFLPSPSIRTTSTTTPTHSLNTPLRPSISTSTQPLNTCCKTLDKTPHKITLTNPKYADYQGRSVYYCGSRWVRGPQPLRVLLSLLLILLPLALFLPFVAVDINEVSGPWAFILITILTIVSIITLFLASCTDPGILPRNNVQWNLLIHDYDEPTSATSTATTNAAQYPSHIKFCFTCKIFRPLRSVHCSICDNCVLHLDHHCPWLGTCVGGGNYHHFLYFLYALMAETLFSLATNIYALVAIPRWRQDQFMLWDDYSEAFKEYAQNRPYPFILIAYSVFALGMVGWLWGFHIGLNRRNETTIEHIKRTYAEERGKNPFSRKWYKNMLALLFPTQVRRPGHATPLPLASVSVTQVEIEPHTDCIKVNEQRLKDIEINVPVDHNSTLLLHHVEKLDLKSPDLIRIQTQSQQQQQQQPISNTSNSDLGDRSQRNNQDMIKDAQKLVYKQQLKKILQDKYAVIQSNYNAEYEKQFQQSVTDARKWMKEHPPDSMSSEDVEGQQPKPPANTDRPPPILSKTPPGLAQLDNKTVKEWLVEAELDHTWTPIRCTSVTLDGTDADLALRSVKFVSSWD